MSSSSPVEHHPDGILFIVSGPSGAGKTSLIEHVRENARPLGVDLYFSVSHTTRKPREGELDGREYHFVSEQRFVEMTEAGEFLEWAHVHDRRYGTARAEVQSRLQEGQDVILDIDVQGARIIDSDPLLKPHSLSVFVFPPSFEELRNRLLKRGLNSEEEVESRLGNALHEVEQGLSFYDYVIINDEFDVAARSLEAAVVARKLKSSSSIQRLHNMALEFKETFQNG